MTDLRVALDISKLKVKHYIELEKSQKGEVSFERMIEILNPVVQGVDIYELNFEELREIFRKVDEAVEEASNPEAPEGNSS
jgi:hypothetical protein